MEIELIPIDDLHLLDENVRIHPQKQIEEYAKSLTMFGQTKPCVIDEDNNVLIGNGLVAAMQLNRMPTVACFRKAGMADKDKKKMILADNKIFSLGMDLSSVQFKFITEINELNIPGFDENVVATILANQAQVTAQIAEYGHMNEASITQRRESVSIPDGTTQSPESVSQGRQVRCPHCGEGFIIP